MKNVEKDIVLDEIKKGLNWRERIIVRFLKKYTYKVCGIAEKIAINNILSE